MSNEFYNARLIEWAILITTVSHPFISYWLETRRDKKLNELKRDLKKQLEAKEERIKNLEKKQENYEKDKRSELRELIRKFKKMHIDNSKPISVFFIREGEELRSWHLNLENKEEKEEYDETFFEQIENLINKLSIPDDEFSFVGSICNKIQKTPDKSTDLEKYHFIKWKGYKEIFGKSTNPFNYFDNLGKSIGNSKEIIFSVNKMDLLCSKILS